MHPNLLTLLMTSEKLTIRLHFIGVKIRGEVLEDRFLKSLALASRPQVLENWPVLGSRTALFFELLKFCEALEKFIGKRFFVETA